MTSPLSPEEREAIGLCICCDALQELVNHSMLQVTPVSVYPGEMEVRFQTGVHRDLFLIRLLDLLSEKGAGTLLGERISGLGVLEKTATHRVLSPGNAGDNLDTAVAAMKDWLEASITPKFWLPNIDLDVRMTVTRHQLLKISGNQAKHNPSRLTVVSKEFKDLLEMHGHLVPLEVIPFVLDDLRDHLSDNLFIYYGSWIAELLNNVRWGIQRYLEPTFEQAYRTIDGGFSGQYRFEVPTGIRPQSPSHTWFHNLMDHVRKGPIVPPFRASRFLREQSSLEW